MKWSIAIIKTRKGSIWKMNEVKIIYIGYIFFIFKIYVKLHSVGSLPDSVKMGKLCIATDVLHICSCVCTQSPPLISNNVSQRSGGSSLRFCATNQKVL